MDSNKETKFSIQYGPKDILDKKFKNKVRGYDPDEVDEFLDGIIRDYEAFTNEIDRLKEENTKLFSRRRADQTAECFQECQCADAANQCGCDKL